MYNVERSPCGEMTLKKRSKRGLEKIIFQIDECKYHITFFKKVMRGIFSGANNVEGIL